MFEIAELGQTVSRKEYEDQEPQLRQRLLEAQNKLRSADFPVILLFAGVDGAGKSETANLINEWMDPRGIDTLAFGPPSQEERERPDYWRFWRALPKKRHIGIFLSAWYSQPLLRRVYGETTADHYERQLTDIRFFESTLANDGVLILKFWMHLSRDMQKKRLKSLEKDPLQSWRVTKTDWKHWKMYDQFVSSAERAITRTSMALAPWRIIEGQCPRFRSLQVGTLLLGRLEAHLEHRAHLTTRVVAPAPVLEGEQDPSHLPQRASVFSSLDLEKTLSRKHYKLEKKKYQGRLNVLHRKAREEGVSTVLVFEGWDAAGKGGAIRRLTPALDARSYRIITIAAPNDEERDHHYLWRFWRHLDRAGRVTIFDRSWYGRVLVERVEGFAGEQEWRRAYAEINDFERQLVDHGTVLVKFWIHITWEEQDRRFHAREEVPYKSWKLTDEDWRNREKWEQYETAVNEMLEQTSTGIAPWVLVEGNDKRFARIKVLRSVCQALEKRLSLTTAPKVVKIKGA